jgi:Fur family ferric uptake transcriptional regulator
MGVVGAFARAVPMRVPSSMMDRFYRRTPRRRAVRAAMTQAEELKNSGLKATLPRIKVLEVFQNANQRHMSAEDVFRVLLAEHADIGLATVYRVLMQFEQAGILSRNHFESGKAVFELNEGKHHDHLVCLDCGRVEEFYDAEIEKRQRSIATARGFELQDHALALYAACTKKNCAFRNK